MFSTQHLTQDDLKKVLRYNYKTGIFRWKIDRHHRVKRGMVAGTLSINGYIYITINSIKYKAHRLAWLYQYGYPPSMDIDHKNRCKTDNSIDNLREANGSQNQFNSSVSKNSKSGIKGICWCKRAAKWRAFCRINGRQNHLGYFDDIDEAIQVRQAFCLLHHGEFYRG